MSKPPHGLAALLLALVSSAVVAAPLDEPELAAAWRTLRVMDCARCHGKDYAGSSGPSIVDYARTQSRDRFVRAVLDGNPGRGMPAYRGNPLVEPVIDAIQRYFKGRADGSIAADDRPG